MDSAFEVTDCLAILVSSTSENLLCWYSLIFFCVFLCVVSVQQTLPVDPTVVGSSRSEVVDLSRNQDCRVVSIFGSLPRAPVCILHLCTAY